MALPPALAQDRFRAAVLGLAVGDALGFPLRGVPASSLARLPALAEDFAPRPRGRFAKGQFSDDTQLMLAAAESVVLERRIDGRSVAAHYAWLWQEGVLLHPPRRLAEAIERLSRGSPWMSAGAPLGVKDPSPLSRALVVGLWNADTPDRIPHDAGVLSVITHKDPTCAAAAAAYARAISLGLSPRSLTPAAFCEALAVASSSHDPGLAGELRALPRLLSWEPERAVERIQRAASARAPSDGQDGTPAHPVPVLLLAVFAALRAPHDFRMAVSLALRAGGEADATAALCGGILGVHLGEKAIPARLRRNVLYGDHLRQVADRLWRARQPAEVAPALASSRAAGRRGV